MATRRGVDLIMRAYNIMRLQNLNMRHIDAMTTATKWAAGLGTMYIMSNRGAEIKSIVDNIEKEKMEDIRIVQEAIDRQRAKARRGRRSRMEKRIRRLENGVTGAEWKTHDSGTSGTITSTASITCLTQIAQGDTSLTREGLKIRLQSLKMRAIISGNASATNGANVLRMLIFFDTQQHGTPPTMTDVLEGAPGDYNDMKEHDTQDRFIVIYDKTFPLNNVALNDTPVYVPPTRFKKYYKTFKGRRIFYIGTLAADASCGKGQLYLLLVSNQATNGPVVDINTRVRFTDI